MEIIQSTADRRPNWKKTKIKNESNIRDPWDYIKHVKLCIIRILGKERERGIKNIFEEIMPENFQNLKKEMEVQVQETQDACLSQTL